MKAKVVRVWIFMIGFGRKGKAGKICDANKLYNDKRDRRDFFCGPLDFKQSSCDSCEYEQGSISCSCLLTYHQPHLVEEVDPTNVEQTRHEEPAASLYSSLLIHTHHNQWKMRCVARGLNVPHHDAVEELKMREITFLSTASSAYGTQSSFLKSSQGWAPS